MIVTRPKTRQMRDQQANKGNRSGDADAGAGKQQHGRVDKQAQARQIHPQRMGGGIADVKQIKRVGQQEYSGGNQRDKREKLPELGPAHVGNAARKPGKNAPGAIFRQQQGHSGQRHA